MAFSLVQHSAAIHTTTGVDTTGANLIVLFAAYEAGSTVSDSKSNTWTALTPKGSGGVAQLFYCFNPTVGSGHTFSTTPITYGGIFMAAFSGATSSPFDVENGVAPGSGTSIQTGSVTPSLNNELIITGINLGGSAASPTINSGFTQTDSINANSGVSYGGSLAYLIQTSASAVNPTWSWTNAATNPAVIATFKSPVGSGFFNLLMQ